MSKYYKQIGTIYAINLHRLELSITMFETSEDGQTYGAAESIGTPVPLEGCVYNSSDSNYGLGLYANTDAETCRFRFDDDSDQIDIIITVLPCIKTTQLDVAYMAALISAGVMDVYSLNNHANINKISPLVEPYNLLRPANLPHTVFPSQVGQPFGKDNLGVWFGYCHTAQGGVNISGIGTSHHSWNDPYPTSDLVMTLSPALWPYAGAPDKSVWNNVKVKTGSNQTGFSVDLNANYFYQLTAPRRYGDGTNPHQQYVEIYYIIGSQEVLQKRVDLIETIDNCPMVISVVIDTDMGAGVISVTAFVKNTGTETIDLTPYHYVKGLQCLDDAMEVYSRSATLGFHTDQTSIAPGQTITLDGDFQIESNWVSPFAYVSVGLSITRKDSGVAVCSGSHRLENAPFSV